MKNRNLLFLLLLPHLWAANQPLSFTHDANSFSVNGRWKTNTDKPGDQLPLRHMVQIDCFRQNWCMEATASVMGTEPVISVDYYKIVRWDSDGIVAQDGAPICVTSQLIINFQDKSVLAINSPKVGAKGFKGACKFASQTMTYSLIAQ